jgi:hypothetical protein
MPKLPAPQTTAGTAEEDILTAQLTLPHDLRPADQTGGGPHAISQTTGTLRESVADSRKRNGEVGLITDSQHRGD